MQQDQVNYLKYLQSNWTGFILLYNRKIIIVYVSSFSKFILVYFPNVIAYTPFLLTCTSQEYVHCMLIMLVLSLCYIRGSVQLQLMNLLVTPNSEQFRSGTQE